MSTEELVEVMSVSSSTVALLNKSEIDQQIATAHKYPRSIKKFLDEALAMVTLTQEVAEECIYALPRDGKTIEGPSARFAEIVNSAWGNNRAGARVVSDSGEFVTAQGVFHDLERNAAITYEVQRRIVSSKGRRYSADMIGVTANAACSIALRNAILKGVPKAFWAGLYEAARQAAIGNVQTLANRRARAISRMQSYGITPQQIFATLGVAGEEDMTPEHLLTLHGIFTAIREGDTTPEEAFADPAAKAPVQPPQSKSGRKAANPTEQVAPDAQPAESGSDRPSAKSENAGAPTSATNVDAAQDKQKTPSAQSTEQLDAKPISDSVLRVLKTKMENAGIGEADIKRKFGFDLDGVTTANYGDVVEWMKDPAQ